MRVLGFTRGEIAYILLGELALLTLIAIPLGLFLGYGFCHYLVLTFQHELFRIPLIIEPHTYALAAIVVIVSAFFSGFLIKLRLDHLDLVSALKTKE
jgi:putative ABC transport system permease protein